MSHGRDGNTNRYVSRMIQNEELIYLNYSGGRLITNESFYSYGKLGFGY